MRRLTYSLPLLAGSAAAWAQEQKKQEPPEFTAYVVPTVSTPGPRDGLFSYVDVALLLAVMGLAAYFVLARRSRREMRILLVFTVVYFGFIRYGCVCSVGSLQNVALALGGSGYVLPFAVGAFFILPLVAALFVGRAFCAGACPLGAIQEVVLIRARRVPGWLDQALSVLPYVYLGAGVLLSVTGAAFLVCSYDPFVPFFRLGGRTTMLVAGAALLGLSTVVGRPFCRYLCPYGVLLRWVAPFARWRVKLSPTRCVECHLCADSCPFGALLPVTPDDAREAPAHSSRRLGRVLAAAPLIVLAGVGLGWLSAPWLARTHATVELADRIYMEDRGRVRGATDASAGFRHHGTPVQDLYAEATRIKRRFAVGGPLLGGWIGLVVAGKLAWLSVRRRRTEYTPDPGACLACGRCYAYCPVEHSQAVIRVQDLVKERT